MHFLIHVGVLVGPVAVGHGVVERRVDGAQVIAAEPQYLASHLTHGDVGTPVLYKQPLIFGQREHLVEQDGPVLLALHAVVGLYLHDKELGGVCFEKLLHPVDRFFKRHVHLGKAVRQAQDLSVLRQLCEGVDSHHGAEVEKPNAIRHLLVKGRDLADCHNVREILDNRRVEAHAGHAVVRAGNAELAHFHVVAHERQPVGNRC